AERILAGEVFIRQCVVNHRHSGGPYSIPLIKKTSTDQWYSQGLEILPVREIRHRQRHIALARRLLTAYEEWEVECVAVKGSNRRRTERLEAWDAFDLGREVPIEVANRHSIRKRPG